MLRPKTSVARLVGRALLATVTSGQLPIKDNRKCPCDSTLNLKEVVVKLVFKRINRIALQVGR